MSKGGNGALPSAHAITATPSTAQLSATRSRRGNEPNGA